RRIGDLGAFDRHVVIDAVENARAARERELVERADRNHVRSVITRASCRPSPRSLPFASLRVGMTCHFAVSAPAFTRATCAIRSRMRFEYPHSLSYQARILCMFGPTERVNVVSMIDECAL